MLYFYYILICNFNHYFLIFTEKPASTFFDFFHTNFLPLMNKLQIACLHLAYFYLKQFSCLVIDNYKTIFIFYYFFILYFVDNFFYFIKILL